MVAAVLILFAKAWIVTYHRLGRLHQQGAQEDIALLGNAPQPSFAARAVFCGNQPKIAGYLLAALKARYVADGDRKGQCRNGPYSWLAHQQYCLRIGLGGLFPPLVQLLDLGLGYPQQLKQVLAPLLGPPLQRKARQQGSTLLIPQLAFFLYPLIQSQMLLLCLQPG